MMGIPGGYVVCRKVYVVYLYTYSWGFQYGYDC